MSMSVRCRAEACADCIPGDAGPRRRHNLGEVGTAELDTATAASRGAGLAGSMGPIVASPCGALQRSQTLDRWQTH